jgi:hypothetical protein
LVGQARTARLGHGTIDISQFWRDLRRKFELKGHPDYSASFDRLKALTHDYRSGVESTLSSGYALEREDAAGDLKDVVSAASVSVVYGESGTGKSALTKAVLDSQFAGDLQIWFGPDQIATALSEAERAALDLAHPLLDVLDASPRPNNILVIDAAERVSRDLVPKANGETLEGLCFGDARAHPQQPPRRGCGMITSARNRRAKATSTISSISARVSGFCTFDGAFIWRRSFWRCLMDVRMAVMPSSADRCGRRQPTTIRPLLPFARQRAEQHNVSYPPQPGGVGSLRGRWILARSRGIL